MKIAVAPTDSLWFNFLNNNQTHDEINFWRSATQTFRALSSGGFFLFKAKTGSRGIVGGGIFSRWRRMECFLAWQLFGTGNGATSEYEMLGRMGQYDWFRGPNTAIGCIVLNSPFFFPSAPIDIPNWSRGIQSLKTYDTKHADGRHIWDQLVQRLQSQRIATEVSNVIKTGKPQLVYPRVGQGVFRSDVVENYRRRCVVTRERTLPALEAAHIKPYKQGGENELSNGLLLRRDIHRLFDLGYVTVDPKLKLVVSRRIREEFENGREYYQLGGRELYVPSELKNRPSIESLTWHNEQVYLG